MAKLFKTLNRKNTDSIKWKLAIGYADTDDVYTFSIADSDYETAPVIKEALKKRVEHGAFGYAGISDDYGEIISEWYKKRYQVDINIEDITPCPTVLNGLSVCLELFSDLNERILIQTPVYHVFRRVIETNNRIVEENKLKFDENYYRIDFKDLENKFNSGVKVLVFCSPHNPVGRVWRKQELDKLINLTKKYNILIISDEIHSDIIMPHNKFISLASYLNEYDNIIIISAPTKVFNLAGLKVAQIITKNKELSMKIKNRYKELHLSSPNLMAVTALKAAYTKGEEWLELQNKHIYDNYLFMKKYFSQLGNIFEVLPLEGTYLAWVKLNISKYNSTELTENLQKNGVFLSDGKKFGTDKDFVRISLACSREQLRKGLEKIIIFLG